MQVKDLLRLAWNLCIQVNYRFSTRLVELILRMKMQSYLQKEWNFNDGLKLFISTDLKIRS